MDNQEDKKLEDCTEIELKAILFDLQNDIARKQNQFQLIANILRSKQELKQKQVMSPKQQEE